MSSRDIANLKNGLIAAWIPSLGSTGYRLVDRVGSNHGVLTGMDAGSDWVVSGGNLSLDFDGVDDFVDNNPWTTNIGTGNFSLSAWVKTSSATRQAILGAYDGDPPDQGIIFDILNTGKVRCSAIGPSNLTNLIFSDGNTSVNTGAWVHVCGVRTGSAMAIYVDGKLDTASSTSVGNSNVSITGSHRIGLTRSDAGYSAPFNGQLDDIRIYNRALSATEVSLLSKERGIGFKTSSRTSSHFAKRYSYKPPKDKTYAAITRSQSDYDSLREGLVLAICPSVSGATGYRAVDVSGRGNHGTVTNADLSTFWKADGGVSANFDGSDDRITGILPIVSIAGVSFWIKPPGTINSSSADSYVLQLRSGGGNFWYIALGAATISFANEYITIFDENGYRLGVTDGGSISGWTHVGIRWNGSAYEIYLNGVQKTTTSFGTPRVGTTTANGLSIGSLDNTNFYTGQIDDVRVYSRSITPPEIRQLASRRGIGLQPTPRHTDYIETREKTYSVIVKSQQEHSSLSEGLVGAWCPSLGATGFRLIDRSGYGNHGTLTNMTNDDWVVSGGAGALDFDGTDDFVLLPSVNLPSITMSLWVYFTTDVSHVFLAKRSAADYSWEIGRNAGNDQLLVRINSNTNVATGGNLPINTWLHVAGTYDNSTIRAYINGVLVNEFAYSTAISVNATALTLGARALFAGAEAFFPLTIDDARIYNRALTPPEIRLLASKRGIGLQPRPKQYTFYQTVTGSKRRRILTGMP